MPTIKQLTRLFGAISASDLQRANSVAHEIADTESKKGHASAARVLKGTLASGRGATLGYLDRAQPLIMSALLARNASFRLSDVALRARTRDLLHEILAEAKHEPLLHRHNLVRRKKLIFTGPPGCGKSMTAQALANELHLPHFVVRFDAVIGAYLGQTAANLRELFRFAESSACVLLFDEIDALGKRRGYPGEVGELDRIVIALMQELEFANIKGFIIATSNMPDHLDDALWRRFDTTVEFPAPSAHELRKFSLQLTKKYQIPTTAIHPKLFQNVTNFADAESRVQSLARTYVLTKTRNGDS